VRLKIQKYKECWSNHWIWKKRGKWQLVI
jgi:hypothetical protein